jgi:beta-lactamase regulating signal transducer with metallopeptidase domain
MIGAWMLSALVVGTLCALGALVTDATLSLRRGVPVRWVWGGALLLAALLPVVHGLSWPRCGVEPQTSGAPGTVAEEKTLPGQAKVDSRSRRVRETVGVGGTVDAVRRAVAAAIVIPVVSHPVARVMIIAWIAATLLLAAGVAWSLCRLHRDRRRWERAMVHGVPVLISDGLGPALVGVFRPEMVLPRWVLALDELSVQTILVHEQEHRRAGDTRLIASGIAIAIAMPWNLALWWMVHRLLRAVEFDCDARVIARGMHRARYAELLLGAWAHAADDRRLLPTAAFAERHSKLGQRVTHMLRQEPRGMVMKSITGTAAVALISAALIAAPSAQLAQAVSQGAPPSKQPYGPMPLVVIDGVVRADLNTAAALKADGSSRTGDAKLATIQNVDSAQAVRLYGAVAARGAMVAWTQGYVNRGGAILPSSVALPGPVPAMPESATPEEIGALQTARLTEGLTLTDAQQAGIRRIVVGSIASLKGLRGPGFVRMERGVVLLDERNAAIRRVLADPTLVARFDARMQEPGQRPRAISLHEAADVEVRFNILSGVPASDGELQSAVAIVERSLAEEVALFRRTPADTAAHRALFDRRIAGVRGVLDSPAKRLAFDARLPAIRRLFRPW